MISLSPVGSSSGAANYYAADNYYSLEDNSELSEWQGRDAASLGLVGKVEPGVFERVLEGKLPDGTELAATRGEHRPGLDLTFSPPKSVSLVALLGKDERVVEAFRASVAASLQWAERNLAQARVWQNGRQVTENTGNLLTATFQHDQNRNGEPQIHIHAVVANATLASDGKWHALKNDSFYNWQHALGTVHNADLRARLEALGYETVPAQEPRDGSFEIKGISREAVEAFSTRSAEINAVLDAEGRSSPREREIATLATRKGKEPALGKEERGKVWSATAEKVGLNLREVVEGAKERASRGETVWDRVIAGIRGIHAKGMRIAAAMGLTPRDRDELVPERKGWLTPKGFAAAQAVASAARELTEREAAFDRIDLLHKALERGGPVTAQNVELRIAQLQERGLLHGIERMLTTNSMLSLERKAQTQIEAGKDTSPALANRYNAALMAQKAAKELDLRPLNGGQIGAAVDILSSTDRVHLVQGGAGTGKSAALGPVASVAKAEGRQVHALAIATRTAREFGDKLGVEGKSIAAFLARHRAVIGGYATPEQMELARNELTGSYIMVDEASMVGTEQYEKVLRLANIVEADRVVMAGDVKQLLAIDAGKPFEQSQDAGVATSEITENLRAASPQMKGVVAALENDDVGAAFEALKSHTYEMPRDEGVLAAAAMWINLHPDDRKQTLLLTQSRSMRSALNEAVQERRAFFGELKGKPHRQIVLDRVTVTKEGARQLKAYRPDRVVEFNTNLKSQGIERGERGRVIDIDEKGVRLKMQDGRSQRFDPGRLSGNLKYDAVTVFEESQLNLHKGDQIRWTTNDHDRGLANSDIARVEDITKDAVTISTKDGEVLDLKHGDRMLERLDLAYAVNTHIAQGMTARDGIMVMSEREKMLNSTRSFLVAATRFTGEAKLIVDSAQGLERGVTRNPGDKTSAIETAASKPNRTDLEAGAVVLAVGAALSASSGLDPDRELQRER